MAEKNRKGLYEGKFNFSGEIVTLYRRAHTLDAALRLMFIELARVRRETTYSIKQRFNGEKPNYEVTLVEKKAAQESQEMRQAVKAAAKEEGK